MSSYQLLEDQEYVEVQHEDWEDSGNTTTRQNQLPPSSSTRSKKDRSKRKESKTTTTTHSGSDTEKETSKMSSRISRRLSSSSISRKDKSSSKSKQKTDDWTDVTEPDERRRIQNRIAQRKFSTSPPNPLTNQPPPTPLSNQLSPGEKAREQKDRAQRDAQNQQYAGSAYQVPAADDISFDDADLSGLPWGGLNMRHVVARGHASASSGGHHTTSHHSSHHSGYGSAAGDVGGGSYTTAAAPVGTPLMRGADLVDQTLYGMNPYGYHSHVVMGGDGSSVAGGGGHGDVAAGGYYDSSAGAYGYYHGDFDTVGDV